MNRLVRQLALVGLLTVFTVALAEPSAHAQGDKANCEDLEIKAKKAPGKTDPKLAKLSAKLRKPPFNSWKTFVVDGQHNVSGVERMKVERMKLKQGGTLTMLLRDIIRNPGSKPRLRLSFSLDDKSGKRRADLTIKVDSADYALLVSSLKYADGDLLIAAACRVP